MKRLFQGCAAILCVLALMGCGDATEVGNPTGDIPITRTIKGTFDLISIENTLGEAIDLNATLDPELLTVLAQAEDSPSVDGPVDGVGRFSIDLEIGVTYTMEVLLAGDVLGSFSFMQRNSGNRANGLRINAPGDDIDLGIVDFDGSSFIPENEPHLPPYTDIDVFASPLESTQHTANDQAPY